MLRKITNGSFRKSWFGNPPPEIAEANGKNQVESDKEKPKEDKPMPKIIYSGYLTKQGKLRKTWKQRWFVLTEDGTLSYYVNESLGKRKGHFNIRGSCCGPTPWDPRAARMSGELFAVQASNGRTYLILADSKFVLSHWKTVFVQNGARWATIDSLVPLKKSKNEKLTDSYEFGPELGRGGFSIVYKAQSKSTSELVAIKIVDKAGLAGSELLVLSREMENVKTLDHPNIVKLREVYDSQEELGLVYELIADGELFQYVVKDKFPEVDTCGIIWQLLQAVHYLHEIGIAHRDLKLENILCEKNPKYVPFRIVLADFGFSKNFQREILSTSCGTLDYAAPELLTGESYTQQVDMWSVGVITFVTLSGDFPFEGRTQNEIVEKIITQKFQFAGEIWKTLSDEAKDFIDKLLKLAQIRMNSRHALQHPWLLKHQPNIPQMSIPNYGGVIPNSPRSMSFKKPPPPPPPGIPKQQKE